jgi:RNA polymerase sigma-70 factor (ECF subfamily)
MSVESAVRLMYLEGQRKWPRVQLAFDAFESHCGRLFTAEESEEVSPDAADVYLCCACAAQEAEALRSFESEGTSVATAAISRIDRDPDFVQETMQEVWDKLLLGPDAKVAQYSGRGPLKAWIRVTATRVALDRCRSRGQVAARHVELSDRLAAQDQSPESFLTRARFGDEFQRALQRAVAALSAQERNVLRMHVAGQCSIDEIGRAYNVHRATAARWIERARADIYEAVRRDLCSSRHAQLTESEFKSLAHLIGSELELNLSAGSTRAAVNESQTEA